MDEAADNSTEESRGCSLECKNLEVRGTWTGDLNQPADLKISVEVQSLPETELPLLHTGNARLLLIKTSVHLQSNKCQGQPDEESPQSPLFAFSLDADDSDRETTVFAGSLGENDGHDAHLRSPQEGPLPSEYSQSSPDFSSDLGASLPTSQDGANSPRLGKRTAYDACLSDPETSDKKENFNKGRMVPVDSAAVLRPRSAHSIKSTHSSRSDETLVDKPSMIPKPAFRAGLTMPEKSFACVSSSGGDVYGMDDERHVEDSDIGLISENDHSFKDQAGSGTSRPKALTGLLVSHSKLPTSVDQSPMEDTLTSGSPLLRPLVPEVAEKFQGPQIETATAEPQLETRDGILFMKCSRNVRPAVYKITLTVSISLKESSPRGWHELVIPGLPRTRPDDSGTFLFLIPEDKGIEFDTRNLQRYEIVENCFFAEFISHGDLVIPLRLRDSKSHGIQDFTVEQEIRAVCRVDSIAGETQNGDSNLVVQYHAVCSIKLHHRCFWAERCCFFLNLDGGPEGSFQYELGAQIEGLKVVQIPTTDNPTIGVSHIKIICSPRDLSLFCLAWTVKAPIRHAMSWLPRVFPATSGSYEEERYRLRHKLTELDPVLPIVENNNTELGETEGDERCIPKSTDRLSAQASSVGREVPPTTSGTSQTNDEPVMQRGRFQNMFLVTIYTGIMVLGLFVAVWINHVYFKAIVCQDATYGVDQYDTGLTFSCSTTTDALHSLEDETVETYAFLEDLSLDLGAADQVPIEPGDGSPETVEPSEETKTEPARNPSEESNANAEAENTTAQLSLRDRIDYWLGWTGPDQNA